MNDKALNKAILKVKQSDHNTLYYIKFEHLHGDIKYGISFDKCMIYWNGMKDENPFDITDQIALGDYVQANSIVEYTTETDKIILIDNSLVINAEFLKYIDKNSMDICYNPFNVKAPLNIYEEQIWVGSVFPIYYNSLALIDIMEINVAMGKGTRKIYK